MRFTDIRDLFNEIEPDLAKYDNKIKNIEIFDLYQEPINKTVTHCYIKIEYAKDCYMTIHYSKYY